MIRKYEVTVLREDDRMGDGWKSVIGDRELEQAVTAEFGIGEEVLGMLSFADGTQEVGQGEAMRPYLVHYTGDNEREAYSAFLAHLMRLSFMPEEV